MPWMKTTVSVATKIKMTGSPFVIFALFCALLVSFTTAEEPDFIYFPDENGTAHFVNVKPYKLTDQDIVYLRGNLSTINFLLYTRNNPTEGYVLTMDDVENLPNSNWNSSNPTRIVTHGWMSSGQSAACTKLRDSYLTAGHFNVIVINWMVIASNIRYNEVAASIPIVAAYVSSFINYIQVSGNLDTSNTLLVGHSLGAHLVSLAANGATATIAEVVGLDPARPCFTNPETRISSTHANYVQVIHTNGGKLGLADNVGTADFHVNGGKKQPGCLWDVLGICAHSRAYEYFAESILYQLNFRTKAIGCENETTESCFDVYMGGPRLDYSARGSYTLPTASTSPYGLG